MFDDLFPKTIPYDIKPDEQLYFMHIAKTAGRSFENFLKAYFPAEQTIRIDVDKGYPEIIPPHVFTDYKLYLGHLGYYFISLFPENRKPLWITLLRDPVERVISFYYFFRNAQPVKKDHISYRHQFLAKTLSLLEFVESDETSELVSNYQFNNLLDSEMLYYHKAEIQNQRNSTSINELMALVKDRLQNECIFFGITEHYNNSIALLCYTFNWTLPSQISERLNVTPDKPDKDEITPEVIGAIRRKVELDIEIYDFACELFERRISAMINRLLAEKEHVHQDSPISVDINNSSTLINSAAISQNKETTPPITNHNSIPASRGPRWYSELLSKLQMFYLSTGRRLGILKPPLLFDSEWYLKQNPDVVKKNMDPYIHYKLWGWKEGRNPSPGFDVAWYLSNNSDIREAGVEPLDHYIKYGKHEKRSPLPLTHLPSDQHAPLISFPQLRVSDWQSKANDNKAFNPRLCFHFPASPNDSFFSQIAMFRLALNSFGGIYEQADVIITMGDDNIKPLPQRWKPYLSKNVKLNWVDPKLYQQYKYDAQSDAQWLYPYEGYDFVCIVDADVMIIRPIDDLLFNTFHSPSIAGTIAHFPFPTAYDDNPQQLWLRIANQLIQKPVEFGYRHTLSIGQPAEYTFCPFYINFGFILLTPEIIREISTTHLNIRPKVALELEDPYFAAQVSLALTLALHNIPTRAIGLRYNFPNDEAADQLHLNELRDVRLIHYLRTDQFDRQRIFTSRLEFENFLSLDLAGSNKVFQEFIRSLTHGNYPF